MTESIVTKEGDRGKLEMHKLLTAHFSSVGLTRSRTSHCEGRDHLRNWNHDWDARGLCSPIGRSSDQSPTDRVLRPVEDFQLTDPL